MGKEGSPEPLDNSFYRRKLHPLMQRWLVFLFLGFTLAPSSLAIVGSKHMSQENVSAVTEGPLNFLSPRGVAAGSPEWRPEAIARGGCPPTGLWPSQGWPMGRDNCGVGTACPP